MAFLSNIFLLDFRTLPTMWYFLFLYQILELLSHFNKKLTVYTSFTSSILFIQIKVIKHKNKKRIKKQKQKQKHTKHKTPKQLIYK
jgi:quinol-cytochrome oxidoreductase complex cytochrome b subunit